jgi:subtilisin family serine protease
MYARIARMMTFAATLLLFAAPASAAKFSLVEVRASSTPFLQLTGAQELSPSLSLWRIPTRELRQLRLAGQVRLAEPERQLAPAQHAADPLFANEWWLAAVGATNVVAPGPGVPVVVVDTGIDLSHPEFAARADTSGLNQQSIVDTGTDFHGTAVASIIGAPVNDVGMVGVYPQAVLGEYDADLSGAFTAGQLIRGIDAAAGRGPVVINISVGSTYLDPLLRDEIFSAFRRGALVVAASGNSGAHGPLNYPANLPHVLTVGATDSRGVPADFSSASQGVDLAAPGVGITAAVPLLYSAAGYQSLDGTSFSAPIVSGAAALVWTVRGDLDNTQLFDLLRFSARDVWRRGFDAETGFGILDIPSALAREEPVRDAQEPNDDVRLVKAGGLFPDGSPPLTTRTTAKASLRATLDVTEDPSDLYRLWVPAHRRVTVAAHSTPSVRLRVWRPGTNSISEPARAAKRDLAASGTTRVLAENDSSRGGYYYVDVRLAHGVGNGSYELGVTTSAGAKR